MATDVRDEDYDLDGVSFNQRRFSATRDYELAWHDIDSLIAIRRLVDHGEYKVAEDVREHLEYLEKLMEKIKLVMQKERSEGIQNLSLERDFRKVQRLFNDLSLVLSRLERF